MPEQLGQYLSALANGAGVAGKPTGYLIFGVDDETHQVVGTDFDPYRTKAKGNQDLLPWLGAGLNPNTGFELCVVDHPNGRVVLFEVGTARDQPVSFYGTAYVRVGASKTELGRHPEKARAIWTRGTDWSAEVCERARLDDLDPDALAKAREQFLIKHPARAQDIDKRDDTTFLNKARVLKQGAATNTALLLLGRPESAALLSPAVARISWILKDDYNRERDYEHIGPPFLLAGDRLLARQQAGDLAGTSAQTIAGFRGAPAASNDVDMRRAPGIKGRCHSMGARQPRSLAGLAGRRRRLAAMRAIIQRLLHYRKIRRG